VDDRAIFCRQFNPGAAKERKREKKQYRLQDEKRFLALHRMQVHMPVPYLLE
jgi:hypothetical protein